MPFQVIYTSSAVRRMERKDLTDILDEARERNARLGVTGMLLYNEGNFLQVLEGEEQTVRDLYALIQGDGRHSMVTTLRARPSEEREFPDWTMGFQDLKDLPEDEWPEGATDFMTGDPCEAFDGEDASHAHQALLHFRNLDDVRERSS